MNVSHSKIIRIIIYLFISVLILVGTGLTALAATGELQTAQNLFTPPSPRAVWPVRGSNRPRYVDVNLPCWRTQLREMRSG